MPNFTLLNTCSLIVKELKKDEFLNPQKAYLTPLMHPGNFVSVYPVRAALDTIGVKPSYSLTCAIDFCVQVQQHEDVEEAAQEGITRIINILREFFKCDMVEYSEINYEFEGAANKSAKVSFTITITTI